MRTTPQHISQFRRKNVWYTVKDGNWYDPTVWAGNENFRRLNVNMFVNGTNPPFQFQVPTQYDDVVILHNIGIGAYSRPNDNGVGTTTITNFSINNLFIAPNGKLVFNSAVNLNVLGDLRAEGALDLLTNNQGLKLVLWGTNNYVNTSLFTSHANSFISYAKLGNQTILDLPYGSLEVAGLGIKKSITNVSTTGQLNVVGSLNSNLAPLYFDLDNYNLTVGGSCTITSMGSIRKTGAGSLIFGGYFNCDNRGGFDVSGGNPTIEFKNGAQINGDGMGSATGTGAIKFTTNNQTYSTKGSTIVFNNPITVENITLQINNGGSGFIINNYITGTTPTSTLNNNGNIVVRNTTQIMATGVFNWMFGAASIMTYNLDGVYTLPYTTYANLSITQFSATTSIKNLAGNTTLTGSLSMVGLGNNTFPCYLDCGTYDLTIGGAYSGQSNGVLRKTGAGNITVGGAWNTDNRGSFDFSGNPTIEFKNGFTSNTDGVINNFAASIIKFTTNNQTVNPRGGFPSMVNATVSIENIIVTVIAGGGAPVPLGVVNGTTVGSKLINQGLIHLQGTGEIMTTGIVDFSTSANTVFYNKNADQDVKAGTYRNLTLSVGGVKKLLGNVSVVNTYSVLAPATVNANGFAITNP